MKKIIRLLIGSILLFMPCCYGFHDMYEESPSDENLDYTVTPGNGSWIAGRNAAINNEITVRFRTSMDPVTLVLSGTIPNIGVSDVVWSATSADNDTLILRPSVSGWGYGTGSVLTIQCRTSEGRELTVTRTYNIAASVYYVLSSAAGALTGTRDEPMNNIQTAVGASSSNTPGVVLVAQGDFTHSDNTTNFVNMVNGVSLYGGYSASDWERRNPQVYRTVLRDLRTDSTGVYGSSLNDPYRLINFGSGIGSATILDGFELRVAPMNSGPSSPTACAVFINNSSPKIQNNIIVSSDLSIGSGSTLIGIRLITGGSPEILNNTIALGIRTAPAANCNNYGIYITSAAPVITGNSIHAGESSGTTGNTMGIYIDSGGGVISGNSLIHGGTGTNTYGVYILNGTCSVTGNTLINGGTASVQSHGIYAYGSGTNTVIENNGLIRATGTTTAYGIYLQQYAKAAIKSNILDSFSAASIYGIQISLGSSAGVFSNYINTGDANISCGIRISNDDLTDYNDICNNVIAAGNGNTSYGIQLYTLRIKTHILNNTINGGGGTAIAAAIAFNNGGTELTSEVNIVNNNLFTNYTTGSRYGVYESDEYLYPELFAYNNIFNCRYLYYDFDGGGSHASIDTLVDLNGRNLGGADPAKETISDNIYSIISSSSQYRFTGSFSGRSFHISGLDVSSMTTPALTADRDGHARTNPWSIGAYEYD